MVRLASGERATNQTNYPLQIYNNTIILDKKRIIWYNMWYNNISKGENMRRTLFAFRISEEELSRLQKIAEMLEVTKGEVLRQLINKEYKKLQSAKKNASNNK